MKDIIIIALLISTVAFGGSLYFFGKENSTCRSLLQQQVHANAILKSQQDDNVMEMQKEYLQLLKKINGS